MKGNVNTSSSNNYHINMTKKFGSSYDTTVIVDLFHKNLYCSKKEGICDALRDLVPFVQFKRREKHPWKSVNFSKIAGFSLQLY